jgi:hypothetical protein
MSLIQAMDEGMNNEAVRPILKPFRKPTIRWRASSGTRAKLKARLRNDVPGSAKVSVFKDFCLQLKYSSGFFFLIFLDNVSPFANRI